MKMRLIDADAFIRFLAEQRVKNTGMFTKGVNKALNIAISALKNQQITPTVDAVPVVRCRNCKHWNEETGWCDIHSHFQYSDGEFCRPMESNDWKVFPVYYFCADGERVAKTTRGDENGQA